MSIGAIIFLIILGIVLLLVEFLIVPGVTIAGIGGFLCLGAGVFAAYYGHGAQVGTITLVATLCIVILSIALVLKSRTWKKVMLDSNINGNVGDVKRDAVFKIGDHGKAITRLAPIGKAMFHDKIVEAKSITGFINENTEIEIVKIQNTNVVVKPLN
ncbi:MAG: NfeD family protein [Bacteroidales bacterium]|nr:NfeD family protein [Bacteroidales bacterium]